MDLDSGKIRPRRRDTVGSQNAPTGSTAERSTPLLIRLPHLAPQESAQDTSTIRPNVPSAGTQTQRVDKPAAIRPAPRTITTAAAPVGSITTGPSQSAKSVVDVTVAAPAADLPAAESVTRWRIDGAHVPTPSAHSAANRQEASRNNWLAQIVERKSLLAIGIIALATGIIAIGVVMFNQSHQQLSAPVRPDAASAQPSNNEANPRFMPATPRASSDTDLRLPSPSTIDKPTAAGNVPGNSHQEPIPNRSLLPAAVLGTTFNDPHAASSNAVANGSVASPQLAANTLPAMNSPASIAQSNPPIQAPSAGAPIGKTSSVPVMADYHLPARTAAPFSNSIPAGINPNPNADPVLEARRQSLPAISTNTPSAASNIRGAASFDGGIIRPLDSIPR